MIIQKVKDYNREARTRWYKAVDNWDYRKGGFPCLAMYLFIRDNGQERQRGFVLSEGNSHYFRLTKNEVDKFLKEKLK